MQKTLFPSYWHQFGASVLCSVMFPLAPMMLEWTISGQVSDATMLISAIMYVATISMQSNSAAVFILGYLAALGLAVPYGITLVTGSVSPTVYVIAAATIFFFAIIHVVQRYDIHVVRREDFLAFRSGKE